MNKIRLTKEFHFEMAHALHHYDGLCRHIHGHSYILMVTLIGESERSEKSPKQGMVMDFSDLKKIVKEPIVDHFDHALVLNSSVRKDVPPSGEMYEKVHFVDFQPTCENLVVYIADVIRPKLPDGVELFSVRLYETATSFAEWVLSDQEAGNE